MPTDDADGLRLKDPIDAGEHLRGTLREGAIQVVGYQDFLCPYCRNLSAIYRRLRAVLGERLVYAFRHFPREDLHPGAELAARAAEAAGRQDRFFEMHDLIFARPLPITRDDLIDMARELGLDTARFVDDLDDPAVRARVDDDVRRGRDNAVTGTPTLFVDGLRYDGAWDYHSMLEALEGTVAIRVRRTARIFASLPASAGMVLLGAGLLALVCANSPLAGAYERAMTTLLAIGPTGSPLALPIRDWLSEGLLSVFFLLVGLDIRREMTKGTLVAWRAALLPIVAAVGGVVAPALVYLAFNPGPTAHGWAVATVTDIAFTLALLAVLGERIPVALRVFVAALAVVDDLLSMVILALFYPHDFTPRYAVPAVGLVLVLVLLNRARVYATWPYVIAAVALWCVFHALGVHAALAGVILALCLPTQPAPSAIPLLSQAATALSELEHAEQEAVRAGRDPTALEGEPVWDWAVQNLAVASQRFASPAERIERAVAPWSAYLILPLFAFSAAGVELTADFSSPNAGRVFIGVVAGLVVGKPLGVLVASGVAVTLGLAVAPVGVTAPQFVGAAFLCGVADTMALLMADRAFAPAEAEVAKLGALAGTVLAGTLGTVLLARAKPPVG